MTAQSSMCTHTAFPLSTPLLGTFVHYAVVDSTVINTGMQVLCVDFDSLEILIIHYPGVMWLGHMANLDLGFLRTLHPSPVSESIFHSEIALPMSSM